MPYVGGLMRIIKEKLKSHCGGMCDLGVPPKSSLPPELWFFLVLEISQLGLLIKLMSHVEEMSK